MITTKQRKITKQYFVQPLDKTKIISKILSNGSNMKQYCLENNVSYTFFCKVINGKKNITKSFYDKYIKQLGVKIKIPTIFKEEEND
jgi:hypothetical protein